MKTKHYYLFTMIILLFVKAQASSADSSIFASDIKIENWIKTNDIPILGLGVIKDSKLIKLKVYGELQNGKHAPNNTVFNASSLTKTITSMVVLKLVSEGKLDLDEPLYKYWIDPDLANDDRYKLLTTRIILTHQTGFANWRRLTKSQKLEFAFTPGTKYGYSGEGFEYLRRALENKFSKSFDVLSKELIFKPLHMNDTYFIWDSKLEKRFAIGRDERGIAYPITKNSQPNAADLLKTTVEDYSKLVVALLNGKVLTPAIYSEMMKHQVTLKQDKYFGLGWDIFDNLGNGEYAISHGGAEPGARAEVFILPKDKSALIIFSNTDNGYKVYNPLLTAYFNTIGQKIFAIETEPRR